MGPTNSKQFQDLVKTYHIHQNHHTLHHQKHYAQHSELIKELQEFKHLFETYKQEHQNEHTEIWQEIRKILDELERHGISIEDLDNRKTITPPQKFYEDITKISRSNPPSQVQKAYEIWCKTVERRGKDVCDKTNHSPFEPTPTPGIPSQWDVLYSGITRWQQLFFLKELDYFPKDYQNLPVSQYDIQYLRGRYVAKALQLKKDYNATKDALLKLQILWTSRLLHRIYEYIIGTDSYLKENMLNIPLSDYDKENVDVQINTSLSDIFDTWKEIPENSETLKEILSMQPSSTPMHGVLLGELINVSRDARNMFMINIGCPEFAYYREEFWDVDKILLRWGEYQKKKETAIPTDNHTIRVQQQLCIKRMMEIIAKRINKAKELYQQHLHEKQEKERLRHEQEQKRAIEERNLKAFKLIEEAQKKAREEEEKQKIERHKKLRAPRRNKRNKSKLPDIDEDKEVQKKLVQLQARLQEFKTLLSP